MSSEQTRKNIFVNAWQGIKEVIKELTSSEGTYEQIDVSEIEKAESGLRRLLEQQLESVGRNTTDRKRIDIEHVEIDEGKAALDAQRKGIGKKNDKQQIKE